MRKNNLTAKLAMGLYAMVLGTAEPSAKAASPRLPQDALPIPLVRQQSDHSCGPAVLVAVLRYFQVWDGRKPTSSSAARNVRRTRARCPSDRVWRGGGSVCRHPLSSP